MNPAFVVDALSLAENLITCDLFRFLVMVWSVLDWNFFITLMLKSGSCLDPKLDSVHSYKLHYTSVF